MVSSSGNICDMPLSQFDTFGHKAKTWDGGLNTLPENLLRLGAPCEQLGNIQ